MPGAPAESESAVPEQAGSVLRGAFEAACAATLIVAFASLGSAEASQLVAGWAGLVLGGAIFALGPVAWARARSKLGKRLALLVASLASLLAVVGALEAGSVLATTRDLEPLVALMGAGLGLALGLGQALAGIPFEKIAWRDGSFSLKDPGPRGIALATYGSLVALVPFFVLFFGMLGAPAEKVFGLSGLIVYAFPILTILRQILGPAIERGTEKLLEKKPPLSSRAEAQEGCRRSLALAANATDPGARKRLLEAALENARVAYAFSLSEDGIPELSSDRRRYLELVFLLGRTDEIAAALDRHCEGPVLQAELARLRGEPERAIALALDALGSQEATATDRANAQSILALAEAELGRYSEARERLEAIARAQKMVRPFVPRFSASSVDAEISRLEGEAAKKASQRARAWERT